MCGKARYLTFLFLECSLPFLPRLPANPKPTWRNLRSRSSSSLSRILTYSFEVLSHVVPPHPPFQRVQKRLIASQSSVAPVVCVVWVVRVIVDAGVVRRQLLRVAFVIEAYQHGEAHLPHRHDKGGNDDDPDGVPKKTLTCVGEEPALRLVFSPKGERR